MSPASPQGEQDLADFLKQLGQPLEEFRPSLTNQIAGLIVGVIGIVGGIILAVVLIVMVFDPSTRKPWNCIGGAAIGIIIALGGGGLIYAMVKQFSYRYLFCANGLLVVQGKQIESYPWNQIA